MHNISRLLSDCMADIPFTAQLTPQQREAAEQLHAISIRGNSCTSGFYEHIIEERKRKKKKFKEPQL